MKKNPKIQHFKRNYLSLKDSLPEVAEGELKFLTMSDFYDGPLEGIVEHKGKNYRYEIVSDFVNERRRYFALLELSDEDHQHEMDWDRRFEEYRLQEVTNAKRLEWEKAYRVYIKQRKSGYKHKEVAAWFYMY